MVCQQTWQQVHRPGFVYYSAMCKLGKRGGQRGGGGVFFFFLFILFSSFGLCCLAMYPITRSKSRLITQFIPQCDKNHSVKMEGSKNAC